MCHAVSGRPNEMFSDFQKHVIGVPQIAPEMTNYAFDGPEQNEDFGLEQVTGDPADRYMFRTSPLRNVACSRPFSTTALHAPGRRGSPPPRCKRISQGLLPEQPDLPGPDGPLGPMAPVLARLDPLLAVPVHLTDEEFRQLVDFVRNGLLDPRAQPENLRTLVPKSVPSGRPVLTFEFDDNPITQSGQPLRK